MARRKLTGRDMPMQIMSSSVFRANHWAEVLARDRRNPRERFGLVRIPSPSSVPLSWSFRLRAGATDDFPTLAGAERPPGIDVDVIRDKGHVAVTVNGVEAATV